MPIFDIRCAACGYGGEVIQLTNATALACPSCGSDQVERQMSTPSTLTGRTPRAHPGPGDTACCGSTPSAAGCSGPGSCCGKTNH
jgi:putative FmdB family regulatory protein